MDNAILPLYTATKKTLKGVVSRLRKARSRLSEPSAAVPWEDELGRMRLWGAEAGLHNRGQPLLEVNLRDSTHIRKQIIKLLQHLKDMIDDVLETLNDEDSLETEQQEDRENEHGAAGTEVEQLHECIATTIDDLFRMSVLSRKPAQHDFIIAQGKQSIRGQSDLSDHIGRAVENALPAADVTLTKRIAFALVQGMRYLDYRCSLHPSLFSTSAASSATFGRPRAQTRLSSPSSSDDATGDSDESGSDITISKTSTIASKVPNIPTPTLGPWATNEGYLRCPYCFATVDALKNRSWRRHLLGHLCTYICVDVHCQSPYTTFAGRDEWCTHMQRAHAENWICPYNNGNNNAEEHQDHSLTCPLCLQLISCGRLYERHVADHLENFALNVFRERAEGRSGFDTDIIYINL